MNLKETFLANTFIQERPWSLKVFSGLICLYLASILLITLPLGKSTQLMEPAITASTTATEYLDAAGGSDVGSYIKAAMLLTGVDNIQLREPAARMTNLSTLDRLLLINQIGYGMWPPGMFFLNAIPLTLSADAPLALFQVIVASVLWALAFALIVSLLAMRIKLLTALALPFLLMPTHIFHYFFQSGVGSSETYSAALLVIGFSILFQVIYRRTGFTLPLIAGLCFATASFMRAQVFFVAVGISVVLAMFCFITIWKRAFKTPIDRYSIKISVLALFLTGFGLPVGSYMYINGGDLLRADYAFINPFIVARFPDAGGANFVALGGGRAACEVDLKNCEKLRGKINSDELTYKEAKSEVIKAFIQNPISFSTYKLPIAWEYWLETIKTEGPKLIYFNHYLAGNTLILLLFAGSLAYMVWQRLWLFFSLSISTCALLLAPPFFLHFEARYFYLMKVYFLFSPLWLVLIYFVSDKSQKQANNIA